VARDKNPMREKTDTWVMMMMGACLFARFIRYLSFSGEAVSMTKLFSYRICGYNQYPIPGPAVFPLFETIRA
jgi:hypothetical protein